MTNEEFYDAEVAPVLRNLATICAERGMSLIAGVQYEPKAHGSSISLGPDAGKQLHLAAAALMSGGKTIPGSVRVTEVGPGAKQRDEVH